MNNSRTFIFAGGLSGALGVALSAVAAHRTDLPNLGTAANMLLFHAPAFLALSMMIESRTRLVGGWILAVGLALFAGDLLTRAYFGTRLFPMAAPTGGTLLIAGWLIIGISAFTRGETFKN